MKKLIYIKIFGEDATNIDSFKTATNWSEYADIIVQQNLPQPHVAE